MSQTTPANLDSLRPQGPNAEELVYEKIRSAIIERHLPAGTRLPEETLAEAIGVGRGHVRKALARLAHDYMVTQIPNRGAIVSKPTPREAREVFTARRVIETAIVKGAIERMTPAGMARLHCHVEQEQEAARRGDRMAILRLSGDFHMALAEIAGNGPLQHFLVELVARSSLILSVYEKADTVECAHDEHTVVLGYLESGDVEKATVAMLRHLDEIEGRLNLSRRNNDTVNLFSVLAS